MSTLNLPLGRSLDNGRAASLSQIASWRLLRVWSALERHGQRRAAPALARLGAQLASTDPELAARLAAQARAWQAH